MRDAQIAKIVEQNRETLINLRRDFHSYPELGCKEFETSKKIEIDLQTLGLEVKTDIAGTGVSAVLESGRPGPTLMLRADMDALPIIEDTGLEFSSKNLGVMHACGHDGHISMMLMAARILISQKDKLNGRVKFFFQPNEEYAGADISVKDGVLENPSVDAVIGCHLWASLKTGQLGIVSGPLMASSYYFTLKIHGKGGHAGQPHTAVNPNTQLFEIVSRTKHMQTEELDVIEEPTVVSFCHLESGSTPTIIPDTAVVEGSIRCLHTNSAKVHHRFEEIVSSVCESSGCSYDLQLKCGNNLLYNDPKLAQAEHTIGAALVGEENIVTGKVKTMLGDDFSEFSNKVPGCYIFIGTGDPNKKEIFPHHHPKFDIDENSLTIGTELIVQSVLNFFQNNTKGETHA